MNLRSVRPVLDFPSLKSMLAVAAWLAWAAFACALDLIADPGFQRGFMATSPQGAEKRVVQWNRSDPPVWGTAPALQQEFLHGHAPLHLLHQWLFVSR